MAHALTIDPATGALLLEGLTRLEAGSAKAEAAAALGSFLSGERDFGNGYAWLYFDGLIFGDSPCWFGLCFFEERLHMASLSVDLPGGAAAGDWPTRKEIDAEVAFVRAELRRQLNRSFRSGEEGFDWGWAYSLYDPRGETAATGIRYK